MSSKSERKTSTGHTAGLHSGGSFGEAERTLKRERDQDLAQMDQGAAGRNAETVYRDKRGRKLDMLSEFMKQQSSAEGKQKAVEKAQYDWGTGAVQKKATEESRQEMLDLASAPFARTVDDPKLERMRKETTRVGDPMAEYFASKREKEQSEMDEQDEREAAARDKERERSANFTASKPPTSKKKPLYNGPTPAPNRFNIRPGYRWDAVDRSNSLKFEHKVLLKMNERSALKDDAYKWSVSDL
jgi:pre-mRNA-splicing factor CWC26